MWENKDFRVRLEENTMRNFEKIMLTSGECSLFMPMGFMNEKGGEYGSHARLLFSNIMELSRALQHNIVGSGKKLRADILNASSKMQTENVKVGYQGIKGANGHEATLKLFPNGDAVNYKTFADVFRRNRYETGSFCI